MLKFGAHLVQFPLLHPLQHCLFHPFDVRSILSALWPGGILSTNASGPSHAILHVLQIELILILNIAQLILSININY
ncbi:hypothetical protein VNO78_21996 [Psophocarpus tetragonolobus]|uniref:Uncharacterized protein n=1 Tax=Psophocarpus tetragonolobus TaxID=3891 RepID=A0AAN9SE49_PSOTE